MGCLWKQEVKRAFHLREFLIAVFFIAGGFALTMFRDYGVVDGITALQETMGNVEFAVFGVVGAAIPYSASFVSEWKSRNFLYQIGRSGIREYCISKLLACFLAGGIHR